MVRLTGPLDRLYSGPMPAAEHTARRSLATGADFLQLDPAAAPARGLTGWLVGALRAGIRDGRLPGGTVLPATRLLADDLGVSRGVIVEAYQRLADEGLVSARQGAGTTVLPQTPPPTGAANGLGGGRGPARAGRDGAGTANGLGGERGAARAGPGGDGPGSGLGGGRGPARPGTGSGAARAGRSGGWPETAGLHTPTGAPALLDLPRRWGAHAELDLSPGVPDLSAFPRAAWLRAERTVLASASAADLGYGDPRGSERLRTELTGWLARSRGIRAQPDAILIVAGVAQAMALLAQQLRAAGISRIAVEDPGSRGARDELAHWGLQPVPVPVDEHGLDVAALARSGAPAVLLTPAHQFPTGVVLAAPRRRALLDWAAAGGLVIEDDYDAEYRYDRAPVPAVQASGPDRIAYTGSTSKSLAPGMRLGWLISPPRMYTDLVVAKHASDLGSPALPQLVLAQLIASGELDRHVRQVRTRQRGRRDALLAALREQLPGVRVQGVPAGLHLLITFPGLDGHPDDTELGRRLQQDGVLVHPLSWHRVNQDSGPPGLVLGYAAHAPDQLREAARRIVRAVHDWAG
jgi:GntR family transcriptional regulator/MocR family aminotransferase